MDRVFVFTRNKRCTQTNPLAGISITTKAKQVKGKGESGEMVGEFVAVKFEDLPLSKFVVFCALFVYSCWWLDVNPAARQSVQLHFVCAGFESSAPCCMDCLYCCEATNSRLVFMPLATHDVVLKLRVSRT